MKRFISFMLVAMIMFSSGCTTDSSEKTYTALGIYDVLIAKNVDIELKVEETFDTHTYVFFQYNDPSWATGSLEVYTDKDAYEHAKKIYCDETKACITNDDLLILISINTINNDRTTENFKQLEQFKQLEGIIRNLNEKE